MIGILRRLMRRRTAGEDTIKKLEAETIEDEDPFNFITQLLKKHEILELPENNPQDARQIRTTFLYRSYREHMPNIRRMLGDVEN